MSKIELWPGKPPVQQKHKAVEGLKIQQPPFCEYSNFISATQNETVQADRLPFSQIQGFRCLKGSWLAFARSHAAGLRRDRWAWTRWNLESIHSKARDKLIQRHERNWKPMPWYCITGVIYKCLCTDLTKITNGIQTAQNVFLANIIMGFCKKHLPKTKPLCLCWSHVALVDAFPQRIQWARSTSWHMLRENG